MILTYVQIILGGIVLLFIGEILICSLFESMLKALREVVGAMKITNKALYCLLLEQKRNLAEDEKKLEKGDKEKGNLE